MNEPERHMLTAPGFTTACGLAYHGVQVVSVTDRLKDVTCRSCLATEAYKKEYALRYLQLSNSHTGGHHHG